MRPRLTGILASHLLSVSNNLISDLAKVVELLSRQMQELSPLVGIVLIERSLGNRVFYACQLVSLGSTFQLTYLFLLSGAISFWGRVSVDQLEDQRSTSDDTGTSG